MGACMCVHTHRGRAVNSTFSERMGVTQTQKNEYNSDGGRQTMENS